MSPSGSASRRTTALAAVLMAVAGGVALRISPFASSASAARAAGPAAAGGASPTTMVVGSSGTALWEARSVSANGTSLRVGHRRCAVAAGTPLAALAAVRRAGGPGFAIRDYGRCGPSAASSGELFVYSIGGQRNRGQDGWEYKVDERAGSTGAADPSGPRGDGRRIRSGQRLLWFWCRASGAGCQRTLAVSPSASTASSAGTLAVTVTGYDNEGHGTPIAGAIVTLGTDFASTDAHGRATLIAPATGGRYALIATGRGLVQSFPETIVVR